MNSRLALNFGSPPNGCLVHQAELRRSTKCDKAKIEFQREPQRQAAKTAAIGANAGCFAVLENGKPLLRFLPGMRFSGWRQVSPMRRGTTR